MKQGTKVKVSLSASNAALLGINSEKSGIGEVISEYTNGVAGHYVKLDGKTLAIADKYNALVEVV